MNADQRDREMEALRERLSRLSEASLRINESLDFDQVLQGVLDSARSLTSARYGVMTLLDDGGPVQDFLSSGLSAQEAERLWLMPEGLRIFQALTNISEPMRVPDLAEHVRALGFTEFAIPLPVGVFRFMASPMFHRDVRVGHVFVGDREDGGEFTMEDEETLVMFASQAALVIANARRYREEQRARAGLETLIDTTPVGVVVLDTATGTAASFNPEARRIVDALRSPGQTPEDLLGLMTVRRGDGSEVSLQEFPLARVLGSSETVRAEEIVMGVADGRSVTVLLNATPIRSDDGEVDSVVVTMQDMAAVEEQERLRAEFLAMVSHELRMPLTSVMGAGTTLLNAAADLDPAEMRQFHRIIVDRAEHMRYLIGDLLDVARIETGALPVDPEPSDLHPLVEEAGGRFRSADARNPLEMELAEGLPLVMADRRRIVQVLGNLFSNAAGYSPEGSPFTLPAVKQPATPAPGPASTGSRRTPRVRVLAVDDNPQDLRYVRDVLARAGYVPVATGDPADVPRLLSEEKPHLALLDLVLPGSDGIALMNDIRKTADVPVIFLSMYGQDETVARALDMGAADYVVKPFSPTELAARIRAALRKRLEPFQGEPSGPYGAGGLGIDYALRRVTLDGEPVELTATEYAVLYELTVHAPRTLTHAVLLQRIWGPEKVGEPWLVRDMVRRLRRKLGDNADNPRHIITEPRVGYRMAEGEASGEGKEP